MKTVIKNNISSIKKICKKYNVISLYIFGSVTKDSFNDNSDIDFIVEFGDIPLLEYGENFFNLKFELEDLLKRKVDLIETDTIENPYFLKELSETKEQIFG